MSVINEIVSFENRSNNAFQRVLNWKSRSIEKSFHCFVLDFRGCLRNSAGCRERSGMIQRVTLRARGRRACAQVCLLVCWVEAFRLLVFFHEIAKLAGRNIRTGAAEDQSVHARSKISNLRRTSIWAGQLQQPFCKYAYIYIRIRYVFCPVHIRDYWKIPWTVLRWTM